MRWILRVTFVCLMVLAFSLTLRSSKPAGAWPRPTVAVSGFAHCGFWPCASATLSGNGYSSKVGVTWYSYYFKFHNVPKKHWYTVSYDGGWTGTSCSKRVWVGDPLLGTVKLGWTGCKPTGGPA